MSRVEGQFNVQVVGLGNLRKLTLELKIKAMYSALWMGAKPIEDEAKIRAPQPPSAKYAKGRLPISIRRTRFKLKQGAENPTVGVGVLRRRGQAAFKKPRSLQDFPWYWWFVHFGTAKQAAQPFLLEAFIARKTQAANTVGRSVQKSIKQLARRYDVSRLGVKV